MTRVRVERVCKVYEGPGQPVRALCDISFSVEAGEFLAITGPSGSGKSTLMNILGCLDIPSAGLYYLEGRDVGGLSPARLADLRSRSVGFIFQDHNLIDALSAEDNVALPLLYRRIPAKQRRFLAERALERVGLWERRRHRPCQLSGGQRQRVAIARALAAEPPLILADEPTGSLDPAAGRVVTDLLRELAGQGHTVIVITHDPALARRSPRVIRMAEGRIFGKDGSEWI